MTYAHVSFADEKAKTTVRCLSDRMNDEEVVKTMLREIEMQGFTADLIDASDSAPPSGTDAGDDRAFTISLAFLALTIADNFAEACPWLLMGIATTLALESLLASLLPNTAIHKHLVLENSGGVFALVKVCVKATLLGLVCPLCSCGAAPLAVGLAQAGAAPAAVLAFLLAAQSSGLDSAVMTWGLLGPELALQRLLGASLLAVAAGLAVGVGGSSSSSGYHEEKTLKPSKTSLRSVAGMCAEVVPPLLVGVLLTKVAEQLVRAERSVLLFDVLAGFVPSTNITGGMVVGRAVVVATALPLQACEHSVAAFARALENVGASAGTAFAFMLVAPATNMATMVLLLRHSRSKGGAAAWRAVTAIICVAVTLSFAIDYRSSVRGAAAQSVVSASASASSAGLFAGLCSFKLLRWSSFLIVSVLVVGDKAAARGRQHQKAKAN
eukprot:gene12866-15205_t